MKPEPSLVEKIAAITSELELAGFQEYLLGKTPHLVTTEVRQALATRSAELQLKKRKL